MKNRNLLVLLGCILVIFLLVSACSSNTTSTTQSSTTQATSTTSQVTTSQTVKTTSTTTKTSTATTVTPQTGGTLRLLLTDFPRIFGNPKEWNAPKSTMLPCLESFGTYDAVGNLVPQLATSWDVDAAGKTITWHLRQGVKFHDGTDFDADAAKWNMDIWISSGKMAGGAYIASQEVVDKYTLRWKLSQYSHMYLATYVQYSYFFSPTYINKVGLEASRQNPVGTGPFKFDSYITNTSIKFSRFDGYYRKGLPYINNVEFNLAPDPTTANMLLQSGQADLVMAIQPKDAPSLTSKGYKVRPCTPQYYLLNPDSTNPKSPLAIKRVREAIEYAINRPELAKALGYGMMNPLQSFVPTDSIMYPSDYQPRNFNPTQAKILLAEAGYSTGLTISFITSSAQMQKDIAVAIQQYLADVGVTLKIDSADAARYNTYQFGSDTGVTWNNGFVLHQMRKEPGIGFIGGIMRDYRPDGIYPLTERSAEYKAIYEKMAAVGDDKALTALGKEIAKQASEDCMAIGIGDLPNAIAYNPKLHTTYLEVPSTAVWDIALDWFEK
jgi:ABC-type transport system substrate-binding protein